MRKTKAITDLATLDTGEVYRLSNTGDQAALDELKRRHKADNLAALVMGDLARLARDERIAQMVGKEAGGAALVIGAKAQDVVKRLEGDHPTALEELLAERIAACWLDVQDQEYRIAAMAPGATLSYIEWRSRMLDRAHKRYLSAIKALATVRRLQLPAIQVNIGDQQINTLGITANQAGGSGGAPGG